MLELYFLNVRNGDSVLVKLPDDRWGIIDSNQISPKNDPPVLSLLRKFKIKHIAFILLTHPHADHYRGFAKIVDYLNKARIKVDAFVDFGMPEIEELNKLKQQIAKYDIYKKDVDDYYSLLKFLDSRTKSKKLPMEYVSAGFDKFLLSFKGGQLRSYAPLDDSLRNYRKSLIATISTRKYFDSAVDHNMVSVIAGLKFGDFTVMFGGDATSECWYRVILKAKEAGLNLRSHLIKISHHGSNEGYFTGLFDRISRGSGSVAVISCGKAIKGLGPHQEVLDDILKRGMYPLCTNKSLACQQISVKPNYRISQDMLDFLQEHAIYEKKDCFGNILVKIDPKGGVEAITENADKCQLSEKIGFSGKVKIKQDSDLWKRIFSMAS